MILSMPQNTLFCSLYYLFLITCTEFQVCCWLVVNVLGHIGSGWSMFFQTPTQENLSEIVSPCKGLGGLRKLTESRLKKNPVNRESLWVGDGTEVEGWHCIIPQQVSIVTKSPSKAQRTHPPLCGVLCLLNPPQCVGFLTATKQGCH